MTNEYNKEILVLGGATHDNRGDLAMMEGLFSQLRKLSPNIKPILYSWNPERSREVFDVECRTSPDTYISQQFANRSSRIIAVIHILWFVFRFAIFHFISFRIAKLLTNPNLLGFFTQLSRSHAVIIHGSGSFNSYWWHDWVYPKTACAIISRIAGKPVILTSQGVGPFEGIIDKVVATVFFKTANFLGVRDATQSSEVMQHLGATPNRIWQTGDDALLMPKLTDERVATLLEDEGITKNEMLIGVNFRNAAGYSSSFSEEGMNKLAISLATVAEQHRARLVFIPISYDSIDDDRTSAAIIATEIGDRVPITIVRNERSAAELRALISSMSVCVGISYHFLLFALNANIPSIGLFRNSYYRQKQTGLFSLFDQPEQCIDMSEASTNDLIRTIDQLILERAEVSLKLKTVNAELTKETASAHLELARIISK